MHSGASMRSGGSYEATAVAEQVRLPADAGTLKDPKLSSELVAVARAAERGSTPAGLRAARSMSLATASGRVRVVLTARAGARDRAEALVAATGGQVEAAYGELVQALVPPARLRVLAASPSIRQLAPPVRLADFAVGGEGVGVSGAAQLQAQGVTGAGVKVAVLDSGFSGLAARQASGDIPANAVVVDFCNGRINASEHGTAVAEIVSEMAPGAQLYLICRETTVQMGQALNYMRANGITIVNHSAGNFFGRGDGTGPAGSAQALAADARASGILWVNSSGNQADRHWSGTFADNDGDNIHNYTPSDEGNTFLLGGGFDTCVDLRWDDWPATSQDFDLYLVNSATGAIVARSEDTQSGGQPPFEEACYENNSGGVERLYVAIVRDRATRAPRFDVFLFEGEGLEYDVPQGSLAEPSTSRSVLAVGAVCWQGFGLEPYSSQGPTIDGRVKPDISGYDAVSSATYGNFAGCGQSGFTGTSAASPTVAGAAALVKQRTPALDPGQIQASLEAQALDLGPAGKDSQFGAGRLFLTAGAPPPPPPPGPPPPPPPPPPVDRTKPQVQAFPSAGRHGTQIRLWSSAFDNSGEVRVVGTVVRAGRTIATMRSGFQQTARGERHFFLWRAPNSIRGKLSHCIKAFDRAGNASVRRCATLTVR
jgi:hypothetical protein